MNRYQVFTDIPLDDNWDNIEVKEDIIEFSTAKGAKRIAYQKYLKVHPECYVWEVTEDDKINDE